jgi:hypothetical protein
MCELNLAVGDFSQMQQEKSLVTRTSRLQSFAN